MDKLKVSKVSYSIPKYNPKYRNLYITKDGRGFRGDGIYETKHRAVAEAEKTIKEMEIKGHAGLSIDGRWYLNEFSHVEQINIIM